MPSSADPATERPGERLLADTVYEAILERILSGEFAQGARLPTELGLARRLGVSRPVLRTALARLRDDGLVVSRQGSGSYVLRRPDSTMLCFAPLGSIADIQRCYEFRQEIEGAAAAFAAERHGETDLHAIEAAYDELERCNSKGQLGVEADGAFHRAVVQASHNPFFVAALAHLEGQVAFGMNLSRNLSLLRPADRLRQVQDEHRAIIAAIASGDAASARAAMQRHIASARSRMFEGDGAPPLSD